MPIANYNNESPLYSGTSDEDNEALEMTAPSLRILSVHLMDTAFDPRPLKLLRLSKRKFDDSFAIYAKVHCGDCQFRSDEAILDRVNKNTWHFLLASYPMAEFSGLKRFFTIKVKLRHRTDASYVKQVGKATYYLPGYFGAEPGTHTVKLVGMDGFAQTGHVNVTISNGSSANFMPSVKDE